MGDDGTTPTTEIRVIVKSEWLRWGVHARHAAKRRRVCQWLRDQPWALARESAPRLRTGAMGQRRSEVRKVLLAGR
jgi:hypothetical protein